MPEVTVLVDPRAKARPRFARGHAYTPRSTERAEDAIRGAWAEAGHPVLSGPLSVAVVAQLSRPKGHFGARGLRPSAPQYPDRQPDLDNYVKTVLDALNHVAWRDDCQVVQLRACKVYVLEAPSWWIQVTRIEDERA